VRCTVAPRRLAGSVLSALRAAHMRNDSRVSTHARARKRARETKARRKSLFLPCALRFCGRPCLLAARRRRIDLSACSRRSAVGGVRQQRQRRSDVILTGRRAATGRRQGGHARR
jgi:hypothetical protein